MNDAPVLFTEMYASDLSSNILLDQSNTPKPYIKWEKKSSNNSMEN